MYTFLLTSVISLFKGKAKMKNQARVFFVCVARYKLVTAKPAFLHHLWSKQNYQAFFVYRSDLRQNLCNFYRILPIILQLFHRTFLQLQIAVIQFRAIEARTSLALAQQLIKIKTTSNVFMWRIQLLDRTVQSGQSTSV